MSWFMIKNKGLSQHHLLCCSSVLPSSLQTPEKKAETSVGDVCLLNLIGVRCFQNTPRCPFFLDLRRKVREGQDKGWRKTGGGGQEQKKVLEEEKQRGRKSKTVELLDAFYVSDEVDWFLPSAAHRFHSLLLPSAMMPKSFQLETRNKKSSAEPKCSEAAAQTRSIGKRRTRFLWKTYQKLFK